MQNEREARIRDRAHEIWEKEGRPEGRHREHWERAAAEIEAKENVDPEDDSLKPDILKPKSAIR